MGAVISMVGNFLYCVVIDYSVYIGIDRVFFKNSIQESSSDIERRNLWLYEAFIVLLAAFFLHIVSHIPRFLYLLSVITALFGLSRAWVSVEDIKHFLLLLRHIVVHNCDKFKLTAYRWKRKYKMRKQKHQHGQHEVDREVHFQQTNSLKKVQPVIGTPRIAGAALFASHLAHELTVTPTFHKPDKQKKNGDANCNWLRQNTNSTSQSSGISTFQSTMTQLKMVGQHVGAGIGAGINCVKSVTSSAPTSAKGGSLPTGLRNGGRNVCFINSVLQVLRQTPGVSNLCGFTTAWHANPQRSLCHEALVCALHSLLGGSSTSSIRDTLAFREAAWQLCSGSQRSPFITSPNEIQYQQDCAEFFSWLMDSVQEAVCITAPQISPTFWTEVLTTLAKDYGRSTYGDPFLSPPRAQLLCSATRNQIKTSSGAGSLPELLSSSFSCKLLRRLADLEWWLRLSERGQAQQDAQVLSELFEGQLLDVRLCLNCRQVNTETQMFRLLPVPLPDSTGVVALADCISQKVGQLERLVDVMCDSCSGSVVGLSGSNAAAVLSPIVSGAGSVVNTAVATPLHGAIAPIVNCEATTSTPTSLQASTPQTRNVMGGFLSGSPHQKKMMISRTPSVLALHLLRFSASGRVNTQILVPEEVSLKEQCLDSIAASDSTYKLYACILHEPSSSKTSATTSDSIQSGHYIALCALSTANGQSETWVRCSDESVRRMTVQDVRRELRSAQLASQVYLLFYRKLN